MSYCAKCLTEYVEGTTQCEDCGALLLPGSPPEGPPLPDLTTDKNARLVPVRVFAGGTAQMDADLARNILNSQGIACILQGEILAEVLPVLDVPLLVRQEDAERAERILQDYLDADIPAAPDDSVEEGK